MHTVTSRPAQVGEKLRTTNFGSGTRGFASPSDCKTAVCVLPGTELGCCDPVQVYGATEHVHAATATFRQTDTHQPLMHHDALEFAGGKIIKLTFLIEGQEFTVLQLPAEPRDDTERLAQERLEVVA